MRPRPARPRPAHGRHRPRDDHLRHHLPRQPDLRRPAALRPARRPPVDRRLRPGPALADGTRLGEHLHTGRALLLDLSDDAKLRAHAEGYDDRLDVVTTASRTARTSGPCSYARTASWHGPPTRRAPAASGVAGALARHPEGRRLTPPRGQAGRRCRPVPGGRHAVPWRGGLRKEYVLLVLLPPSEGKANFGRGCPAGAGVAVPAGADRGAGGPCSGSWSSCAPATRRRPARCSG